MSVGATRYFRATASVGLAYAVTGKLGLLLALPPGYATTVWPPSGIALAGVLLFGTPAWLGVLLGSFAVNVGIAFNGATPALFTKSLAVALCIAAGASAQALVGATLIRRSIGFPHPLKEGPDVLRFSLLGGPVACLVNATVGPTTLLLAHTFEPRDYIGNWLTWWAGDVLGVVLVVPIVLAFVGEPRDVWRPRRLSVAVPLFGVFVIAVCAFIRASSLEQRQIEQEFRERAATLERTLSSRVEACVLTLAQTCDFFDASVAVDRDEFRRFARPALDRLPGLRAIEWLAAVSPAGRAEFEASLAREGFTGSRVHDYDGSPSASDRPLISAVTFIEPLESNLHALGLDVGSETHRRAALDHAADTGLPSASEGVKLLRSDGTSLGVLIFAPVYARGHPLTSVEARRAALRGFVLGAFLTGDLVAAALGPPSARKIAVTVRDADTDAALYAEPVSATHATLRWKTRVHSAGRSWDFEFSSAPAYTATHARWEAWALLMSALLFGALLGSFLLVLTGRAAELERRTIETTQLLSTLVQSSQDAIVAYNADGTVMSWNAGAAVALEWRAADVVGKNARTFVPEECGDLHEANLKKVFAGGSLPAYETLRLTRSGRSVDVAVKLSPVYDGSGEVQAVSEICRDISAAKEADRMLRASLREKELLLKEVHHRVKNNLQVISSLLSLQAQHLPDPAHRDIFTDSQSRVQSIALIHEKLYQSKDLAHVDFEQYVRALVHGLFHAQNHAGRGIAASVEVGGVELTVDAAIPCGLIINELVTNALKHAFPRGTTGRVRVALRATDGDDMELVVEDDGRGLPEDIDPRRTTSLGLDLVFTFAEQLEADVEIDRDHGTAFRFRFAQPSARSPLDA